MKIVPLAFAAIFLRLRQTTGPYDYTNACWLRGMIDAKPKPDPAAATCAAGSHEVGGGKCCADGMHFEPNGTGRNEWVPDGSHSVGGGRSCRAGYHSISADKCGPDAPAQPPPASQCTDPRQHWDGAKCTVF